MFGSDGIQTFLSIAIGLGLAAACGFRVFIPLLIAGSAARLGHLQLAADFQWLASVPALLALGTAAVLEVGAYYIPWLDHALDMVATPAAVVAGILASASVLHGVPPVLRWVLPVIGGGASAGLIQGVSVLFRLKSTTLTGGVANPIVSTAELVGAAFMTLLAIVFPLVCLALVGVLLVFAFRATGRIIFGRPPTMTN
ncbi:MAG TPA: DUF4126 domain-containing protein [Gemmatimonadales bacterium]